MFRPFRSPTARPSTLGVEALETRDVPSTLLVDDDRQQFRSAPYTTISAAVAAAQPGDTVLVARGTYREQVVIPAGKDGLTLAADKPLKAVIQAPATTTGSKAVVEVDGAKNVTVTGFTITGPTDAAAGVLVDNGGSARILSNDILDIRRNPLDGVQLGVGVVVGGLTAAEGVGTAVVADNTISGYQKGGVVAFGDGTSALIAGNKIVGVGPTGVIAQNGVQVSDGADARVIDNDISRNAYTGSETFASGVIVTGAGDVTVAGNRLTSNDVGLFATDTDGVRLLGNEVRNSRSTGVFLFDLSDAEVIGNVVSNSGRAGIFLDGVTDSTVALNESRANAGYGIGVTGPSTGNTIVGNTAHGNKADDLFDDTTGTGTAGTANTWAGNRFRTATPDGLR